MKRIKSVLISALIVTLAFVSAGSTLFETAVHADPHVDSQCASSSSFFGLTHWYDNLPLQVSKDGSSCSIVLGSPNDVWVIVLNIIHILLQLTGIVAVVFIVIGGIRYIMSQGESAGITAAKQTITRAIVGLVIAMVSVLIVTYVSSIFGQKATQDSNGNYKISLVTEATDA